MPGFDRLLEEKAFDALSDREKDQVLQFISEEEYNRFRETVLVAQHRLRRRQPHIAPDPSVKSRLMQRFGSDAASTSGLIPRSLSYLLSHRIPVYQAALAASVLLFMLVYLFLQNHRMPLMMAVADTVYVDRPMLLKDTVWLEKSMERGPELAVVNHAAPETRDSNNAPSITENQLYASQMEDAMQRVSVISGLDKDKSVNHDAGLMKLVATTKGESFGK